MFVREMRQNCSRILSGSINWIVRRGLPSFRWTARELDKSQWMPAESLSGYQLERLQRMLAHAYDTVPYYRGAFDRAGVKPGDCRSLADLERFPILTKQHVVAAGDEMVSKRFPRWALWTSHTSGTTGTPLELRRNLASIGQEHAFVRRQWSWAGISKRDVCAMLTGRVIIPPDQTEGRLYRYVPFMKELVLSTYHLGDAVIDRYIAAMRTHNARALVGYPSAALRMAQGCLDRGVELPMRAVLTSSETLLPEARATIERAFGCQVFDFYGSAERVCYIHTCEKGQYHIIPEYGVTELVPAEGLPGAFRVIATGLWNRAMPFIRYELGDQVELGPNECSCGRQFVTVNRILGRAADCIVTPSGRRLGAALLSHLLYGAKNIRATQVVQDSEDHVDVLYVAGASFRSEDRATFERLIRKHLPSELSIDLKSVTDIPRSKSGKHVYIRNLVGARDRAAGA